MATEETTPRRYRRLKRANDVSTVAVASSSSKRVRLSKEHNTYKDRVSSLPDEILSKEHDTYEDMIGSLPDEILILILDKLDARTTIITTILSKRWLNLPRRSHTCYDFAIDWTLPQVEATVDGSQGSLLKNLLVDNCKFRKIYLNSLPCLETFACRGLQPTKMFYGQRILPTDSLVLQFKGPEEWIEPIAVPSPLLHLKKLFIANVPINWDIFWIVALLDAAPVLESCHVHIDNRSEKTASWLDVQPQKRQCHCLKELIVVSFDAVGWKIGFVKHVMKASPRMRWVHLLDGHVVEDDERMLGGLEVVPCRRDWHELERSDVLDDLWDGICSPQLEIILE
ncbi:hypothetical protein E2562_030689 [Oryza meyeriana var. granulata]|uniref:F-box domain-containing protein n=1 Tax=Oryza meyeriana var. granulata TaxID=110450 RepID=A0A6G1DRA6_9ORYZ|nr:hypothetical protein E2562_030689 [Oryza meyeriana var. granulata]